MKPLKEWIKTPLALLFKTFYPLAPFNTHDLQKTILPFFKKG